MSVRAGECLACGKAFKRDRGARDAAKYCSRACAFSNISDWCYRAPVGPAAEPKPYAFACAVCACPFVSRQPNAIVCPQVECKKEHARRKSREYSAKLKPVVQRACKHCGMGFTPAYGDARRAFCSKRCGKKFARRGISKCHTARARRFGVPRCYSIKPEAVFARDGWRCQLCGCATPERLRGTYNDRAPELDHIIPLSKGGGHTWDNVQCACRACNGAKGNNVQGQLRIAV